MKKLALILALFSGVSSAYDASLLSNESFKGSLEKSAETAQIERVEVNINSFLMNPAKFINKHGIEKIALVDGKGGKLAYGSVNTPFINLNNQDLVVHWSALRDFVTAYLVHDSITDDFFQSIYKNLKVESLGYKDFFAFVYNESSYSDWVTANNSRNVYFFDQATAGGDFLGLGMDSNFYKSCHYDLKKIEYVETIDTKSIIEANQKAVRLNENDRLNKIALERFKKENKDQFVFCSGLSLSANKALLEKAAEKIVSDQEAKNAIRNYFYSKPVENYQDGKAWRTLSPVFVAVFLEKGGVINDLSEVESITYAQQSVNKLSAIQDDQLSDSMKESIGNDNDLIIRVENNGFQSPFICFDFENKPERVLMQNKLLDRIENCGFKMTGINAEFKGKKRYPFFLLDKVIAKSLGLELNDFNNKKPIIKL